VLTVSGSEVGLELCPSFVSKWFFIPPATGAHEVPSCKYFGIYKVDLLWVSNEDAPCLRIICTLLNLLEQGFNRLLWIPCSAHVFKLDFQINGGDVAVSAETMVQHVPGGDIGETNHVVIQNVQIHWFKNTDDLLLQSLLHGGVCAISLNVLLPYVACGAKLGSCAVSVGWDPPEGLWDYLRCWTSVCFWGDPGIGSIRDDESQVSQRSSARVSVNCPRVSLKGFADGVYCWILRFALNFLEVQGEGNSR
jgi:hypothetical protein